MNFAAVLSIITGAISLLSLLILHFTSPEFNPSWRMVSEYALGKIQVDSNHLLLFMGASSILLAIHLLDLVSSFWAFFGLALLLISGIGAICGGLFDVNHKRHGLAFALGVPTLPVAALILTYHLQSEHIFESSTALILSHSTWISIVIMGLSMMLLFSGFKKAGVTWDKDSPPPTAIPKGVIALAGYANRLLVFCFITWVMYMAYLTK
jgi:hypothetical membrane protein